jgi:hypothetical protein
MSGGDGPESGAEMVSANLGSGFSVASSASPVPGGTTTVIVLELTGTL